MKTWSIISAVLAAAVALLLCQSCGSESLDSDWPPMKWNTISTFLKDADGNMYIQVPVDGMTYEFTSVNYKGAFWINYIAQEEGDSTVYYRPVENGSAAPHSVESPWAESQVRNDGVALCVTVSPNEDGARRKFTVDVEAGDAFYTFSFVQLAHPLNP